MNERRMIDIDIAKGIGMLLVIIGHSISPVSTPNSILSHIYSVIYTFHMPLFFFVSGFLSKKMLLECEDGKGQQIKNRVTRLVIPYFVWGIIYLPLKLLMKRFARFEFDITEIWTIVIGNNPDGELWFLYVLFVFSLVTIIFLNEKNIKLILVMSFVVSFFSPLYTPRLPGISLSFSLLQLVFFVGGLTVSRENIKSIQKPSIVLPMSVVLIGYFVLDFSTEINLWFLKLIPAMCGVVVVLGVGKQLSETRVGDFFSKLGKKSMELFILHAPILIVVRIILLNFLKLQNPWLYVVVATIVSLLGSLGLEKFIISKINILEVLLLGKKRKI